MRQTNFQNKLIDTFFNVILAGTLVSLVAALLYYVYAFAALSAGDHSFDWLLGVFSDFVYIMDVSLGKSPYVAADSSYPPFAIIILYPFALICKSVFAEYSGLPLTTDELTSRVILHGEFWISIVLFFILCSAAIVISLTALYRPTPKTALKLGVVTLTSAPFIFTVMRGNTIYFALIFTVLFFILKKSKYAAVRELGYLCLVLAGLIKIYPLFFGVFLLSERKIWASLRIALYSVTLFFASFLIFRGAEDLMPFFENLGGFASNDTRLTAPNNLSLASLLNKFIGLFTDGNKGNAFQVVVGAVLGIVFVICAVAAIITKNQLSRYVISGAAIILIPPISYFYVLIFTILPFLEFLKEYERIQAGKRKFYTLAFLFLFLMPTMVAQNYIIHSLLILTMLLWEIVSVCRERIPDTI